MAVCRRRRAESVEDVEEILQPVAAKTESTYETEPPLVEIEIGLDLQAEVPQLEAEASLPQTATEKTEKSVDLVHTEKGIQSLNDKLSKS